MSGVFRIEPEGKTPSLQPDDIALVRNIHVSRSYFDSAMKFEKMGTRPDEPYDIDGCVRARTARAESADGSSPAPTAAVIRVDCKARFENHAEITIRSVVRAAWVLAEAERMGVSVTDERAKTVAARFSGSGANQDHRQGRATPFLALLTDAQRMDLAKVSVLGDALQSRYAKESSGSESFDDGEGYVARWKSQTSCWDRQYNEYVCGKRVIGA